MTRDGRGEVVGASVYMLKGKNSRDVVAATKEAIDQIRPRLPAGVRIETYYDRSEFINDVIHTIGKNLTEGAIIVIVCLLLTLGSIRAGFLVAGAIPFAMLVGFIGLSLVGYSGNVMSLGAIDFGIVVEGAVVAVEHAMAHGASEPERAIRRRRITQAVAEVAKPAVFGVVITVLTFLPLLSLEDVEGKMFRPVVVSLCFMLVGALIYALVIIPAIAPRFLKVKSSEDPWLIRQARRAYVPAVDFAMARPKTVIAGSFALAALMLGSGATMGAEFLPRIFEGAFAIDATRPPSTSLEQAVALAKETELALKESPEVVTVVNRIGRPEGAVDMAGPESSDVFVILKPRKEWRKGLMPDALAQELSDRVDARVPATLSAFSQPIEMRVNDLIAGVKSDVAIKVFGDDLPTMVETADAIRRTIATVPGAADVKMEAINGLPSLRVEVDRMRAGRLGVPTSSVLDVLAMARAGLPVGRVREGERVFDLVLRVGGEKTEDEGDLRHLPITTSSHTIVPLESVAKVAEEKTIVQVGREQMRRRVVVQANVRGRDVVGFVKEAQEKCAALKTQKSVEVVWGGQFQNFNRAKTRLSLVVPISLAIIAPDAGRHVRERAVHGRDGAEPAVRHRGRRVRPRRPRSPVQHSRGRRLHRARRRLGHDGHRHDDQPAPNQRRARRDRARPQGGPLVAARAFVHGPRRGHRLHPGRHLVRHGLRGPEAARHRRHRRPHHRHARLDGGPPGHAPPRRPAAAGLGRRSPRERRRRARRRAPRRRPRPPRSLTRERCVRASAPGS
jgi:cobalt-zinc-cadmium resistance protein CzcA